MISSLRVDVIFCISKLVLPPLVWSTGGLVSSKVVVPLLVCSNGSFVSSLVFTGRAFFANCWDRCVVLHLLLGLPLAALG